jgi:uncharacterized protein
VRIAAVSRPEPLDPAAAPPADEGPAPRRWGLGEALLIYLASVLLAQLLAGIVIGVSGDTELSLPLLVASFAGSYVGLVGGPVLLSRRRGSGSLRRDFGLAAVPVDVPLGIGVALFATFVLVPVVSLPVEWLRPDIDLSEGAERIVDVARGPGFAVIVLFVALATPFAEELFFRGVVQGALVRRLGAAWGIATASLVFGAVHFQLAQLPALTALGACLGWLVWRTGRLGPAIAAHAVFNGLTLFYLRFFA